MILIPQGGEGVDPSLWLVSPSLFPPAQVRDMGLHLTLLLINYLCCSWAASRCWAAADG